VLDQLRDHRTEKAEKRMVSKKEISKDFGATLGNVWPEVRDILVTHIWTLVFSFFHPLSLSYTDLFI
jgi:hypothetical protein